MSGTARDSRVLDLKAGEWVEVRTREEILNTLDDRGRFENIPFMPEMLQFCGNRYRVSKRADKTCDNIKDWSIRRLRDAVHLEDCRCDGVNHGGCHAGCLIFWKEAWLKRSASIPVESLWSAPKPSDAKKDICTVANLVSATQTTEGAGRVRYFCQATEVRNFTSYMPWWDPRQYIRDIRSGNLKSGYQDDSLSGRTLELVLNVIEVLRAFVMSIFTDHRKFTYPAYKGKLDKTPLETLDLQPGELVEVKAKDEILSTLDSRNRNRGLLFDGEMLRYCGGIYRVSKQVHRIINERTGEMMEMKNPCIILQGVACRSDFHRLCPRAIHHYWRENWLKRVSDNPARAVPQEFPETCEKC